MPIVSANRINIYYEEHGNRDNPVLILVGGLTRDHSIWSALIPYFSKSFRVITPDNRGSGKTDKPEGPYSTETFADDLAALMDAIDIKSAHIVGHSMGGFAAQFLAAKYPERVLALILSNTSIKQSDAGRTYLTERLRLLKSAASAEEMTRSALPWIFSSRYLNEEKIFQLIEGAKSNPSPQPKHALEAQIHACLTHNSSRVLSKIVAPTLVLTGSEDKMMTPTVSKELQDSIPRADLVVIKDAAHMLQIEQPESFCKLINEFFERNT